MTCFEVARYRHLYRVTIRYSDTRLVADWRFRGNESTITLQRGTISDFFTVHERTLRRHTETHRRTGGQLELRSQRTVRVQFES
jgi:hypothetical protein